AAALGASESALPGTASAEALHTFTIDSGASRCFFRDSTTLNPLPALVPVTLADPSWGPIHARSTTVLSCPAVSTSSLSGLHLPSFSTNLRVAICTCTRTGRHLATFTRRPGSSMYTLTTEPAHVAASGQVSALGLCLPSRPRLPRPAFLVSRGGSAAPHSSSFPPTIAPLQILHMDVWGRARVSGQGRERYFLLVVDNYMRYTTVFPLRCKVEENGVAERHIGLVMEVARTSMIHAAAPHFLWPFAVRYAAHQLNLWPRVSLLELG
ncbi:unnamed protein product, partial [Closterium sp. NIES-53]